MVCCCYNIYILCVNTVHLDESVRFCLLLNLQLMLTASASNMHLILNSTSCSQVLDMLEDACDSLLESIVTEQNLGS